MWMSHRLKYHTTHTCQCTYWIRRSLIDILTLGSVILYIKVQRQILDIWFEFSESRPHLTCMKRKLQSEKEAVNVKRQLYDIVALGNMQSG